MNYDYESKLFIIYLFMGKLDLPTKYGMCTYTNCDEYCTWMLFYTLQVLYCTYFSSYLYVKRWGFKALKNVKNMSFKKM